MDRADLSAFLIDSDPQAPGGEDVEYDPRFLELEKAAAGTPEVQYGNTVIPATAPDWQRVAALARDLLLRSRDLRVAVTYTRALLEREGFPGLATGLALISGLLDSHWEHLYPQLDADDDLDPTARVNALTPLCEATGLLRGVRDAPFVAGRAGTFSLRELDYLSERTGLPDGVEMPSAASLEAALVESPEHNAAVRMALSSALDNLAHVEAVLTERVGAGRALDLAPLATLLKRVVAFLDARDAAHGAAMAGDGASAMAGDGASARADAAAMGPDAAAPETGQVPGGALVRPLPGGAPGVIAGPQDVIAALDRICAYYARYEPSSPVPVLLQRARRLVGKSFVEILKDLAPDGLGQVRQVGGITDEQ